MNATIANWPPPLWVPIVFGLFAVVGIYAFVVYSHAWRALRTYAAAKGWKYTRRPQKESFPAAFDSLPSRRLHRPAFRQVAYVFDADAGIRIMKRSDWHSYGDEVRGDSYISILVPLQGCMTQYVVRYSLAARLYDFANDVMHISAPGLTHPAWDCSSTEEQFPGAVICSGDLSRIDPVVTQRAASMKRLAEICQSMEVTFEFVPGYLLISTAGAMAARIDRLYPVVLEMRG